VNVAATSQAQTLTRVARTGIDGTASLDLQPGTYDLTVNANGYRTVNKQVVITAAERQKFAFVLQVGSCPPGPCVEVTPLNAPLPKTSSPSGSYCSVPHLSQVPYPSKLIGSGIEGTVRLRLEVDERGCAHDIQVVKSVHPELDGAAKDAVKTWKFRSAMKDGKAVRVLVEVDVPVKPTTT
jgi:TonB family protein